MSQATRDRLRWGILGTGNIARQFSAGVNDSLRGRLVVVGSRDAEKARSFAAEFRIPQAVGSYDEVLQSADVDAVYVSLPNSMHHAWTIAAVKAGKHVLCEKPFALNTSESGEMFDAAERAGVVVMEAFMYRSHPQTQAVLDAVRQGAVGEVRLIRTSFCYRTTRVNENIRFDPSLAGGGLMDVGCYCLSFSRLVAGQEPVEAQILAHLHASGVDDVAAGTLKFPGGIIASFTCGMSTQIDNTAYISGSDGCIEIPLPWKPPIKDAVYHVVRATPPKMDGNRPAAPGPNRQTHTVSAGRDLYGIEADDFAAAVLDGTPPRVSRQDTIGNMQLLDRLRRNIGL